MTAANVIAWFLTLSAASPVVAVGGGIAAVAVVLYCRTRMAEFVLVAASAATYAVLAALPAAVAPPGRLGASHVHLIPLSQLAARF